MHAMQGAILLLSVIGAVTVLHYVGFSHLFKVWRGAAFQHAGFFLGCGLLSVLRQACLPLRQLWVPSAGCLWRAGPDRRRCAVQGVTGAPPLLCCAIMAFSRCILPAVTDGLCPPPQVWKGDSVEVRGPKTRYL